MKKTSRTSAGFLIELAGGLEADKFEESKGDAAFAAKAPGDIASAKNQMQVMTRKITWFRRALVALASAAFTAAAAPMEPLQLAYFPSFQFVRVRFNPVAPSSVRATAAAVRITAEDGHNIIEGTMSWDGAGAGEKEFVVGVLADGTYTVSLEPDGLGTEYRKRFVHQNFAWTDNRLGVSETVYPPFTPMAVSGDRVSVVGRHHWLHGLGLWRAVESGETELMSGPVTLVADGGLPVKGMGAFMRAAPHEVIYRGRAELPSVSVNLRSTIEYDGCTRLELTLGPGTTSEELRSLWLDVPLIEQIAPLWHVAGTGGRCNLSGTVPAGDEKVWDSRRSQMPERHLGTEEFIGNFLPYVWLGGEENGICWFADNDAGWVLDLENDAPCLELFRRYGALTLRIHFVQKPILIKEPRTIVFGLMVTPAKPMPSGWRNVLLGRRPAQAGHEWLQLAAPTGAERLKTKQHPDYVSSYWEQFLGAGHSETRVYADEWTGGYGGGRINFTPSYMSFAVWNAAEFLHRGIGLYLDNTLATCAQDPLTTTAYRLPDGRIQASAQIWSHRDYLKRIWILHRQIKVDTAGAAMMLNTTGASIVPCMVWSDWSIDLHYPRSATPVQERFHHSLLRAQSSGRQSGTIPAAMAEIVQKGDEAALSKARRSRFGALMVHEIKIHAMRDESAKLFDMVHNFGYGQPDCGVRNYWQPDYPVRINSNSVKSLLLNRHHEWLLVLCSWNPDAEDVEMAFRGAADAPMPTAGTDEETAAQLPFDTNAFKLRMEPYGVRILRFN